MPQWLMLNLQDGASLVQTYMIFFHDHTMTVLVIVTVVVAYMILSALYNSFSHRALLSGQTIELIWTLTPAIILCFIALPSLRLLYHLDEVGVPDLTVKVVGHQGYWSYEYSDLFCTEFDSYMVTTSDLNMGELRLLEVDNRMVVPGGLSIRVLVSAADVLHSWTVPSLGVKVDAVPGRLNQISFTCPSPGVYYGQCSEICGANHSFMPIVVESRSAYDFMGMFSWEG
uniref:Cytochrome c oxidase subunit 2 n=1 Tax=Pleurocryptella fimbriata TaxID=2480055 RepID=A0A8K1Y3J7_9CRUS|nr:cytochrome c oxidase subunit II [Pleurocryptella fimbriata]